MWQRLLVQRGMKAEAAGADTGVGCWSRLESPAVRSGVRQRQLEQRWTQEGAAGSASGDGCRSSLGRLLWMLRAAAARDMSL